MRIYIKDRPLRIKKSEDVKNTDQFDLVLDTDVVLINEKKFKGNILILNASHGMIKSILFILHHKKPKALESVTLTSNNYSAAVKFIKSKFKIIEAGGGIVYHKDKSLLIYRLGKWDLPKGKIEKGESTLEGAKREVEEECNVEVSVLDKVCVTWHTYVQKDRDILKKTTWYHMECIDDANMKPQLDEGIDEVKWMNKKEVSIALYTSYFSIQHVYKKFLKHMLKAHKE